ncbi:hypothetical protein [Thioalkalivibrio sulfidiphilus]|uniref:hypothetical protein n=1 Tax=Thioalkalivibrio sulfidiphilus TaxID=1033854 RepID=UPI003B365A26
MKRAFLFIAANPVIGLVQPLPDKTTAFGIGGRAEDIERPFTTHPPLEERIAAPRAAGGR